MGRISKEIKEKRKEAIKEVTALLSDKKSQICNRVFYLTVEVEKAEMNDKKRKKILTLLDIIMTRWSTEHFGNLSYDSFHGEGGPWDTFWLFEHYGYISDELTALGRLYTEYNKLLYDFENVRWLR